MGAVLDDTDDVGAAGRRTADRLRAVRQWTRHRIDRMALYAEYVSPLRRAGLTQDRQRVKLGLKLAEFRWAYRWEGEAVARVAASAHPITLTQALALITDRQLAVVTEVALLREQGATRQQVRGKLGLSDDEYDLADELYRDGLLAAVDAGEGD